MLQFVFDTDHLTLFDHSDIKVWRRFVQQTPGSVGISAVSVEENLRGRLAALAKHHGGLMQVRAYGRLVESLQLFQHFPVVAFDGFCEARTQQLRRLRLKVGSQDLRIAAVALVHQLALVTRNRRDFAQVPGLKLEDWSL
jgi:tRNA(fMet)-specific endonuclease VapC